MNCDGYGIPRITVSRRKAMMFAESGQTDHEGTKTLFGQILTALDIETNNGKILSCFKQNTPKSQSFSLTFAGEGGIDAGGLFRDAFVDIAKELMSVSLPLLVKTPNNKNDFGNNRESFMLNP